MTDILFNIRTTTVISSNLSLIQRSELLSSKASEPNGTNIYIDLPEWVKIQDLNLYLNLIQNPDTILPPDVLNLLSLSMHLRDTRTTTFLVSDVIVPHLNQESVLKYLQFAYTNSNADNCEDLMAKCLAFAGDCIQNLDLSKVPENLAQKLIKEALDTNETRLAALKHYLRRRSMPALFDILQESISVSLYSPNIDITVDTNETGNFYYESEVFTISGAEYKVSVCSFAHEQNLEISLKNVVDTNNISKKAVSALNYSIQINNDQPDSAGLLLYRNSIEKMELLRVFPNNRESIRVRIYAKIDYLRSGLFKEILENPLEYSGEVHKMSFGEFKFLLCNKYLNVACENEALTLLKTWVMVHKPDQHNLKTLLDCLRWAYINIEALMNTALGCTGLKESETFQNYFRIALKINSSSKRNSLQRIPSYIRQNSVQTGPRHSYKDKESQLSRNVGERLDGVASVILAYKPVDREQRVPVQQKKSIPTSESIECKEDNDRWARPLKKIRKESNSRRLIGDLLNKIKSKY